MKHLMYSNPAFSSGQEIHGSKGQSFILVLTAYYNKSKKNAIKYVPKFK